MTWLCNTNPITNIRRTRWFFFFLLFRCVVSLLYLARSLTFGALSSLTGCSLAERESVLCGDSKDNGHQHFILTCSRIPSQCSQPAWPREPEPETRAREPSRGLSLSALRPAFFFRTYASQIITLLLHQLLGKSHELADKALKAMQDLFSRCCTVQCMCNACAIKQTARFVRNAHSVCSLSTNIICASLVQPSSKTDRASRKKTVILQSLIVPLSSWIHLRLLTECSSKERKKSAGRR